MTVTKTTIQPKVDPQLVIRACADFWNHSPRDLTGKRRLQSIVAPRHVAMYLLRECCEMTLVAIGGIFGRDHTTVLHAVRSVRRCINSKPEVHRQIECVKQDIDLRTADERQAMSDRAMDEQVESLLCYA